MSGTVGTKNYWNGSYYYEYIPGSYSQTSSQSDNHHYQTGQVEHFNNGPNNYLLQYMQQRTVTSNWSVTQQISATAGIEADYFGALSATYGQSFTKSFTTQSSNTVVGTMSISPYKTGRITCYLPGGYSSGTVRFTQYFYDSYSGTLIPTGSTVTSNQSGWSPINNQTLYSTSYEF